MDEFEKMIKAQWSDTTPEEITEEIEEFCEKVSPGQTPFYVTVAPREGCGPRRCFLNVPEVIAREGGEMICGWTIWQGKFLLDAEFHGVWRTPDGKYVDVTPKPDGETTILFLPDPTRKFEGTPLQNFRQARIDHPAIHRFIKLAERKHELMNKHWKGHGVPFDIPEEEIYPIASEEIEVMKGLVGLLGDHDEHVCGPGCAHHIEIAKDKGSARALADRRKKLRKKQRQAKKKGRRP